MGPSAPDDGPVGGEAVGEGRGRRAPRTLETYHLVPRLTPTVGRPSRFQSPTTGTSPDVPYEKVLILLRSTRLQKVSSSCQRPARNRPGWSNPSPFQSPTTGLHDESPHRREWLAGPVDSE